MDLVTGSRYHVVWTIRVLKVGSPSLSLYPADNVHVPPTKSLSMKGQGSHFLYQVSLLKGSDWARDFE